MQVEGRGFPRAEGGWFLPLVAAAVALGFTALLVAFAAQHCAFVGDDFSGFLMAKVRPLRENLFVPLGSQVVPLQRLANYVVYHAAPMRYGAALAVLACFQVFGLVCFERTLALLRPSRVNAVLVAVYAVFVFTWLQIAWWGAGLERLPFAAFSLLSIRSYVLHAKSRRTRDLVAAAVYDLVALGFYGKAVLLPLYLVGVDLARHRTAPESAMFARRDAARWATVGLLLVAGLVYVPLARHLAGEPPGIGSTDPSIQLALQAKGFTILSHALLGTALGYGHFHPTWAVALFWATLAAYTVYRSRSALVAWGIGAVLVALNFLMIGLSNRTAFWGALVAFEPRYYFDVAFVAVLFTGLALHHVPASAPEVRWATSRGELAVSVFAAALLVALAALSHRSVLNRAFEYSSDMPKTRSYLANLEADLRRLRIEADHPLVLTDGVLPVFVTGLDLTFRRHSDLLATMQVPTRIAAPGHAAFRVDDAGHVVSLGR